ncbi:MAG: GNAT family N-acetyltransferase [Anaerolineae bacterium]|jgi:hypothetical protein|nr:GNAT family N-acetyltransferase [Anaerolineae bacterium]
MKTTHRDYNEAQGDFYALACMITDHNTWMRSHSTWSIGRLVDWKYGIYEGKQAYPDFCGENAHLWFDGFGRLAGCVVSEGGGSDVAILTLPGYRFLFEEILAWVMTEWANRPDPLSIELTDQQQREAAILEQSGFMPSAPFFSRRFNLTRPLPERLPLAEGFTIVDMQTHPDYRAQRILRADAFSGQPEPSEDTIQHQLRFYNHSIHGPIYHAPTDLCVMAPDGRMVAGCEALIDAHNNEADIERVCTHSAFRRRGFARAVIQECLYRLQGMGIAAAYITGYSQAAISLYGSLGAEGESQAYSYTYQP